MIRFHDLAAPTPPPVAEVGGKAHALALMAGRGLPVPGGFVLPVDFFAPQLRALEALPEWASLHEAPTDAALRARCDALKARAGTLALDDGQRQALAEALSRRAPGGLFAVRSSSPEEDLESASFAGAYESVLGVPAEGLEPAILRVFASCLDARVALYMRARGMAPRAPRIAVIIQEQLASEVAGVGFSLNPVSNAYDEAVFTANWGLGETVVAGEVGVDLYSVDKVARKVLTRQPGAKETSRWVVPGGGTVERPDLRRGQLTLTDAQLLALTDLLLQVERLFGGFMDIEWALVDGRPFLLQARPITTHLQLPEDMVTAPGARKRLYGDLTIVEEGCFWLLSPLGTSWFEAVEGEYTGRTREGRLHAIDGASRFFRGGRIYMNVTHMLGLVSKDHLVRSAKGTDLAAANALATVDASQYRPRGPRLLRFLGFVLRGLTGPNQARLRMLRGRAGREPAAVRTFLLEAIAEHRQHVRTLASGPLPFPAFLAELAAATVRVCHHTLFPVLGAIYGLKFTLNEPLKEPTDEEKRWVAALQQSLPGNPTVDMGLELGDLARQVPMDATLEDLERAVAPGAPASELRAAWESFLERHGHRGPTEIDVAGPRYREQPRLLLELLHAQARHAPEHAPRAVFERNQREREEALRQVLERLPVKGRVSGQKLRHAYEVVCALGGFVEGPKFCSVASIDALRTRVLREADALVSAGRLDAREQVFELTCGELSAGLADPALDLRALAARNRRVHTGIARFPELPRVIDSRGRIYRPAPEPRKEGELEGVGISAGVYTGRVRVMHSPDDKPLLPGEVLVARATNPGWTPLFLNAGAVILELGGLMLQHGGLVAREYGKPCVSGVEGVTQRLRDGMRVQVDGSTGRVRILPDAEDTEARVA